MIIGMSVGGFLIVAGIVIGRFMPARRKLNTKKLVCGCTHHLAMHDPETKECSVDVWISRYDSTGNDAGYEQAPCACRQYIGPPA